MRLNEIETLVVECKTFYMKWDFCYWWLLWVLNEKRISGAAREYSGSPNWVRLFWRQILALGKQRLSFPPICWTSNFTREIFTRPLARCEPTRNIYRRCFRRRSTNFNQAEIMGHFFGSLGLLERVLFFFTFSVFHGRYLTFPHFEANTLLKADVIRRG